MWISKKELLSSIIKLEQATDKIKNMLGEEDTVSETKTNIMGYPVLISERKFTKLEFLAKEIKLIKEFLGVKTVKTTLNVNGISIGGEEKMVKGEKKELKFNKIK